MTAWHFTRLALICCWLLFPVEVFAEAEEKPFYLTLDPPPAPELSPREALASFTLAPGFTIAPVAVEPLVEDPVAITWDEAGNLYVVEMRGFMPDAYGHGEDEPVGMIVRLIDENRDGIYDKREVLLDSLVLPRAVAVVNEGLLVGEPPHLWLCPGSNGWRSIDCSRKVKLGEYGNQPGSVEHAENGLILALDNWMYSAKSERRLKVSGGELVVEPTLFRGQWGIAQDNLGRLFYNTNSNLLMGDSYDAQPVIATKTSAAPGLSALVSENDEMFAVRVNPGVNRAYVPGVLKPDGRLNRPTSASGMAMYRGDQFGSGFERDVYVTEPAANAVARLQVSYNGLEISSEHVTYPNAEWGQVEFLASTDERFRPVNVYTGPDGALYIVDMYRGIIQDHIFLTDQLRDQALERGLDKPLGRGRIWRVRREERPVSGDLEIPNGTAELVEMLGHPNGWHRDTAQRLLLETRRARRSLERALKEGSELQQVHAIWTLAGREELDTKLTHLGLAQQSVDVRLAALQAGHNVLEAGDLLALIGQSEDVRLTHHAILYLAPHNRNEVVEERLLALFADATDDAYRKVAVLAAARGREVVFLERWPDGGAADLPGRLAAQALRVDPDSGGTLLDVVAGRVGAQEFQQAVLDGVFAVTRDRDFERVMLSEAHSIFDSEDEALWQALGNARRAFTWPGDDLAANAKPLTPIQEQARQRGAEYYSARCATCHGEDGLGIGSLAPRLADSEWVTGPSERLARVILHGLKGPISVGDEAWDGVMPGHAAMPDFTDEVAAGLMTFLGRSWGHTQRAVEPDFMTAIRETEGARDLWTGAELDELDVNTHYRAYTGRFGGPGMVLEFGYNGRELTVTSPIFNGPMLETKEDHFLFEPRDLQLEFVWNDGAVSGVRMATESGGVELPRMQG